MRITHVSDCFLPRLGGIEVQVAELAGVQRAAGHQTAIVTATRGPGTDPPSPVVCETGTTAPAPGGAPAEPPVHRVVAPLPFELPVHPRAGHHLGRLFHDLKSDVVHVHLGAVSPFAWSAVRCAVRAGLPTVVTVHSMWDPVTQGIYRGFDVLGHWSRWPLVITTVSEAAVARIERVVSGRIEARVVPNGIETSDWKRIDRHWRDLEVPAAAGSWDGRVPGGPAGWAHSRGDAVHVVAVGRLAPRKRPIDMLRMLHATRERLSASTALCATVVGDGPARPAMERYLRRHHMLDWVAMPGRLDRSRVLDVLASADVFLAPAELESFGLAALEARTAGVPVVAHAGSGIADFVASEREGILGSNPGELVDAMVRLVTDRALRLRIAEHNRVTEPDRCTWSAVFSSYEQCYARADALAAVANGRRT